MGHVKLWGNWPPSKAQLTLRQGVLFPDWRDAKAGSPDKPHSPPPPSRLILPPLCRRSSSSSKHLLPPTSENAPTPSCRFMAAHKSILWSVEGARTGSCSPSRSVRLLWKSALEEGAQWSERPLPAPWTEGDGVEEEVCVWGGRQAEVGLSGSIQHRSWQPSLSPGWAGPRQRITGWGREKKP